MIAPKEFGRNFIDLVAPVYIRNHHQKKRASRLPYPLHTTNLMALFAGCSKTAHVFVAIALMVLLAAVVSAGRVDLPMADNKCSKVGACSESVCAKQCGISNGGTCKIGGLFVYCCCRRAYSTSVDAHPPSH